MTAPPRLVLASQSRYRQQLLLRIFDQVEAVAADIDERPLAAETPADTALRLARSKARRGAELHPGRVVIGSDQVAELAGAALGKPGSAAVAREQLRACSDREVRFHTAVCVVDTIGGEQTHLDCTTVQFRTLEADQIDRYLALEQPFDCAGSFKVEGLGICLFQSVHSEDPTALIGLPLIATCRLLRAAGIDPLADPAAAGAPDMPIATPGRD